MGKTATSVKLSGLAALTLAAAACIAGGAVRTANIHFKAGEYDQAVKILEVEAAQHPHKSGIQTLLYRARLNSYYFHLAKARERDQAGDRAAASAEYQKALAIFPGNRQVREEMESRMAEKPKEAPAKSRLTPPIQLGINPQARFELTIFNTPITNIFKALGKNYGINFVFDREFRDGIQSVDIRNKTFYEILRMLCLVSNSDYRIVDSSTVLIFPDQPYKKQLFGLKAIQTFYLSNIRAEDAVKILTPLFTAAGQGVQIQPEPNLNALIVKGDRDTLADIERFLPNIDIQKSEVEIDVEIIEINRNLVRKLGNEFSANTLSGQVSVSEPSATTAAPPINTDDLGAANFYLTLPSVALNLLEADDNNKLIAKPNLRGLDGEKISYMVGDELPIPRTTFGSFAAGGVSTIPTTQYEYKNVGVEIKITPYIHHNAEVTLETELTINFISGYAADDFPILGKREIKANFRLKEDETNIIGGFIRDDVRRSLKGVPALSRIPILGRLFGSNEDTIRQTDLIFAITPRIIRRLPLQEKNREPVWINIDQQPSAGGATMGAAAGRPAGTAAETPPDSAYPRGMRNERSERPDAAAVRESAGNNALTLVPALHRITAGGEAAFTVTLQCESPLQTLTLRGACQGGGEIIDLKAEMLDPAVKTMKYAAGGSFDAGFTFPEGSAPPSGLVLLQLRIKYPERGRYTLTVESVSAADFRQGGVTLASAQARIEVL